MPRYIVLVDWTEQGVQAVEQTVGLAWWTQGSHDMVSVIDAADEQAMVAYMLAVTRLGNLRATTLRAWNADEMREIVGQLPQ